MILNDLTNSQGILHLFNFKETQVKPLLSLEILGHTLTIICDKRVMMDSEAVSLASKFSRDPTKSSLLESNLNK